MCAQAIERTASSEHKITMNTIRTRLSDLMYKITSQKFEDPSEGEEAITTKLAALTSEIKERFRALEEEFR